MVRQRLAGEKKKNSSGGSRAGGSGHDKKGKRRNPSAKHISYIHTGQQRHVKETPLEKLSVSKEKDRAEKGEEQTPHRRNRNSSQPSLRHESFIFLLFGPPEPESESGVAQFPPTTGKKKKKKRRSRAPHGSSRSAVGGADALSLLLHSKNLASSTPSRAKISQKKNTRGE